MSNSDDSTEIENNNNFGLILAEARKSKNYSVEYIYEHLRIPKNVIIAIEANDIEALPAPTFTQGYIRAYAKFMEIAEERLLDMYNQAVPHDLVSTLKPRSSLPDEASSQLPVVKAVTILLIAASIATVLYGSFQYYQEKVDVMEDEFESKESSFTGNSLDSPGSKHLNVKQNATLTENDELIVERSDSVEPVSEQETVLQAEAPEAISSETISSEAVEKSINEVAVEEDQGGGQDDIIEIFAEKGSWMEVRDVTSARLLYSMIPSGESRVVQGKAPFRISMGNANSTRVFINDIKVDMTGYIRSNNTASFTISNEDDIIIFH